MHDNARPYVHSNVNNFLTENGITIIKQPPYLPDLAPSDFWLIDYVKSNLDDQPDEKALHRAVTRVLKKILIEEYKKAFKKWIE